MLFQVKAFESDVLIGLLHHSVITRAAIPAAAAFKRDSGDGYLKSGHPAVQGQDFKAGILAPRCSPLNPSGTSIPRSGLNLYQKIQAEKGSQLS